MFLLFDKLSCAELRILTLNSLIGYVSRCKLRLNNIIVTIISESTIFCFINKMEKKEIGTMVFTEYKDRFQLFIGLALLLLIIDLMLLGRKNKWSNKINFYKEQ